MSRSTAATDSTHSETLTVLPGLESFESARRRVVWSVAFVSGVLTLAVEVLWVRFFSVLLAANVLVVAVLIAGFLAGVAAGSLLVTILLSRVRSLRGPLIVSLVASGIAIAALTNCQPVIGRLFHNLHGTFADGAPAAWMCLLTLFFLIAVPVTTFGTVYPLTMCWAIRSPWTVGYDVGRISAINTIGAIVGAFVAGFVCLPLWGLTRSLYVCAAAYAASALIVVRRRRQRVVAICGMLVVGSLWLTPWATQRGIWFNGGFTGTMFIPQTEVLLHKEGAEATVAVVTKSGVTSLLVDGTVVAETSPEDLWDLLMKAHLPMLIHENPQRVALVGLGAGISLGAVQAYEVSEIDCAELSADVPRTLPFFATLNGRCWLDKRTRIHIQDGRIHLLHETRSYDVISVDPVDPPVCNQYTEDFFKVCRDRLQDDGIMVQWLPLFHLRQDHIRIVLKAFLNVFPNATLWYDGTSVLLVARREGRLRVNAQQFLERARQPKVRDSFSIIGSPHPSILLATFVAGPEVLREFVHDRVPPNTDDRPNLEYGLLLAGPLSRQHMAENLENFVTLDRPLTDWLDLEGVSSVTIANLADVRTLLQQLRQARIYNLRGQLPEFDRQLEQTRQQFGFTTQQLEAYRPWFN